MVLKCVIFELTAIVGNWVKSKDFIEYNTMVMALGGSTNAVIHYLAIAKAFNIHFTLDDFQHISNNTPLIADLRPSGKYHMEDVYESGGTPAIMKLLLDEGLMHGECLTVTGKQFGKIWRG